MIRLTLLAAVVLFLAFYAWRDWYRALCGAIVLMAVMEHPDMPNSMFGIHGLNPWNALLLVILLAWLAQRRRDGLTWDMPRSIGWLLLLYLAVIVIGFLRMMMDRSALGEYTAAYLVSEHLINTVKWTLPGLLLFDGARSRPRVLLGLAALLAIYFLLALQVIKWMPPGAALSGDALSARSAKILLNEVGYHRVNLSMMLSGASWALLATTSLVTRRSHVALVLGAAVLVAYAQALTGGRMGYVTWGMVGILLCLIRWRRYLLLMPVFVVAIVLVAPGAVERMTQGFSSDTRDDSSRISATPEVLTDSDPGDLDLYTITAGRNIAWPHVIDKIGESPVLGFGRLAMVRTGVAASLWESLRESFPHPHNAYLEFLLDNGVPGLVIVLLFYGLVLARGVSLFRDASPLTSAVGGVACALILALLLASFGSQTFYPREGAVGMWCAIGLMLRVAVQHNLAEKMATPVASSAWWQGAAGSAQTGRPWWQHS